MNQCANGVQYPLSNEEELFATLSSGQVFSKIHLSYAYQQVELDEDSRAYLTINTQKGLFHCKTIATQGFHCSRYISAYCGAAPSRGEFHHLSPG